MENLVGSVFDNAEGLQSEILRQIPTPVMAVNQEMKIIYVNDEAVRILDMSYDDIIGKSCASIFKTIHCGANECCMRKAMDEKEIFSARNEMVIDGEQTPIEYFAVPFINPNGEVTGGLEFILNIKEQVAYEKKLREQSNTIQELSTPILKLWEGVLMLIALSANAMSSDRDKCIQAGMNEHLPKPIEPMVLFDMLLKFIDQDEIEKKTENRIKENRNQDSELNEEKLMMFGIDVNAGLRRVSNNKNLYMKILNKFVESNRTFEEDIKQSIKENDFEKTARIAHTLKGVAGNIGANELYNLAKDYELSIDKNRNETEGTELLGEKFDVLNQSLNNLIFSLDDYMGHVKIKKEDVDGKEEEAKEEATREEVLELLGELERYVETGNIKGCRNKIKAMNHLVLSPEMNEIYKKIEKNIVGYKFKKAIP